MNMLSDGHFATACFVTAASALVASLVGGGTAHPKCRYTMQVGGVHGRTSVPLS
jgi:hypothetical protein